MRWPGSTSSAIRSSSPTSRTLCPVAVLLNTDGSAGVQQSVAHVLKAYPNVQVQSRAQFEAEQAKQVNQLLGLVYALLALAVLIALIGIVNTLMLSVFERTHEIGLLRAVGMRRRQIRAMIRSESVILVGLRRRHRHHRGHRAGPGPCLGAALAGCHEHRGAVPEPGDLLGPGRAAGPARRHAGRPGGRPSSTFSPPSRRTDVRQLVRRHLMVTRSYGWSATTATARRSSGLRSPSVRPRERA